MTVTSGAYRATWNALALGELQLGGFRHRYSKNGREIKFDSVGDTPVDIIQLGIRMYVDAVLMEYDKVLLSKINWPWHAIHGTDYTAGQSLWEAAKPLILTSCTSGITPLTRTYWKAILATGFEVENSFSGVEERVTPVRLMIFPVKYESDASYSTPLMPSGCGELVYFDETFPP